MILIKEQRGVTLIELMIALVISAIIVAGTYSIFISQQRTYMSQDQIVAAQQDGRAALIFMARDIRMAGMLTGVNGFSNCTNNQVYGETDAIRPVNSSAAPDQITVVYAAEEIVSAGSPVSVCGVDVSTRQVTLGVLIPGTPPTFTAISSSNFFNDSTKRFVAFEGANTVYEIAAGGVSGSTLTLRTVPPDNLASFFARVFRVRTITYSVNTSNLTLQRNNGEGNETLAGATNQSQVEDLQFSYQVTGVNYWTFDGILSSGDASDTTLPVGMTNADIRAIRIRLLMRTPIEDTNDRNYSRPTLEDHAGSATMDGYRRREYSTVVKLRNF